MQDALQTSGEPYVAMVAVSPKAEVDVHPSVFGEDDPLGKAETS